ncbi:hypothetical protein ACLOJK_026612 [Asimina triloba]
MFTTALKALPMLAIETPPIRAVTDDSSQPTVAAGDNFNVVGDKFINVVVHALGPTSESLSGSGIDQPHEAHSHTQRQDEISLGFMELVHSVEALKISHCAETLHTRHMHKALAKTVMRMDMDAAFLELSCMKISGSNINLLA